MVTPWKETAMGFDPTTMHMLVRERQADLLRECEREQRAMQALDALPPRAPRQWRIPRPSFRLPFSVRLVIQRRDIAL